MKKYKLLIVTLVLLTYQYSYGQKLEEEKSVNHTSIKAKMDSTLKKLNLKTTAIKGTKNEEELITNDETKVVFFVHGLEGDGGSWSTARAWTENKYNVHTPRIYYSYESSLDASEGTVRDDCEEGNSNKHLPEDYDPNSSIYVAHSMGGVVGLQINYEEETSNNPSKTREFGAMATFGSPLAGAPIVNGSNCLNNMFNEGCKVLTDPFISETLKNIGEELDSKVPGFLKGILNLNIKDNIIGLGAQIKENLCSLTKPIFSFMESAILPDIGHDLDPDGEVMGDLLDHEVTVPTLAFSGEEEDPVSLREIYSLQHNINRPDLDKDNPNPPSVKEFTADYDEGFIDVINDIKDEMEAKAKFWRTKEYCGSYWGQNTWREIDRCISIGGTPTWLDSNTIICRFCITTPDKDLAKKYDKAAQWLRDFDKKYRECFGLDETVDEEKTKSVCKCYIKNNGPLVRTYDLPCDQVDTNPGGGKGGGNTFDCRNEDIIIRTKKVVKHASDGVVPGWSSKKINVADGVFFKDYPMPKSNHQQMRNDNNTGIHLPKMFDGDYNYKFKLNK